MGIVEFCRLVYASLRIDEILCRETIVQNGDCEPLVKKFEGVMSRVYAANDLTVPSR